MCCVVRLHCRLQQQQACLPGLQHARLEQPAGSWSMLHPCSTCTMSCGQCWDVWLDWLCRTSTRACHGVEVDVVQDDRVCACQVEALPASARGHQHCEDRLWLAVEPARTWVCQALRCAVQVLCGRLGQAAEGLRRLALRACPAQAQRQLVVCTCGLLSAACGGRRVGSEHAPSSRGA